MRKFLFAIVAFMGLGAISCSHNNPQNEETTQIDEVEIGCPCCEVEAPADSLDIVPIQ